MSANFITGTGTDIGKTWLVCALLRYWREQGRAPAAVKPVQSGFDPHSPQDCDAGQILLALERPVDPAGLDAVAPWRFIAPLSPDMAAAREGRAVPFDELIEFTRRSVSMHSGPMLIEGVGGAMVPLDARHTVRDWIAASALPAVVAAGSYLGSLSHTLTAVAALQQRGVGIRVVVVNETPGSAVELDATVATLAAHLSTVSVMAIRRTDPQPGLASLAAMLA